MILVRPQHAMKLFINPVTFTRRFKWNDYLHGYHVIQDKCMPRDRILYFDKDGIMKIQVEANGELEW